MKKAAWWIVKIASGAVAVFGTFLVAMGSVETFFLLTGRVVPDFEQPGIPAVLAYSSVGLVMMIVGYKLPSWLRLDRLLLSSKWYED